jgi:aspartyl-tRNA(Asn)/glutamyl-tRNA(Gln) amidotransferase subunit C
MSAFSRADVEAIASLAQLELSDEEITLFGRQLGAILDYVDQLQRLETTGVPPTATVGGGHAADRADAARPSLDRREALANAPDAALDVGFFKVPRVIG